jgi:hypothetical protein
LQINNFFEAEPEHLYFNQQSRGYWWDHLLSILRTSGAGKHRHLYFKQGAWVVDVSFSIVI